MLNNKNRVKYFSTSLIFVCSLLLIQPYSYSEIKPSEWHAAYNLVKKYIQQNKWEEAKTLLMYLKDLIEFHNQQNRFQNLGQLEENVDMLVDQNLKYLYQKGLNQLDNAQFSDALITFRKILCYDPNYQDTKKLLKRTQALKNAFRGIQQKSTIIVTSKTPDKRQTGLRVYKPDKCYNGYTLFAHQPLKGTSMSYIYLIDMHGKIVYQWTVKGSAIFARLTPDGHLFYINGTRLQELDSHSNVIWYYKGFIDHEFQILKGGNFLIEQGENIDKFTICENDGFPPECPRIEIVRPDKKVLWRWKGEEHIEELEEIIGLKILPLGDWANNNTSEIIKDNPLGRIDSRFKKGNIIFSYCTLNLIGIIDYPTGKIVWAWGPGIIGGQHTPTMLKNGNILIFDNGANRGWSRVIELNPLTEEIVWEYHAEPKESFYSQYMSNVMKLPNGNILICEATSNRIFEITKEGEIVWDFISTFYKTTGAGVGIYRAYRCSSEYVKPLLDRIKKWENKYQ